MLDRHRWNEGINLDFTVNADELGKRSEMLK